MTWMTNYMDGVQKHSSATCYTINKKSEMEIQTEREVDYKVYFGVYFTTVQTSHSF